MQGQNNSRVAVVMVPFPAQGHLNQLLHLSHIAISYGIPVHYAGSAMHHHQAKVRVQGWDTESLTKIQFHDFQLPPYASPPPKPNLSVPFPAHLQPLFDISTHLRKPVSELLEQLSAKCRRVIVVHDSLMASVVQDVKFIPNAESFRFVSIPAFSQFFSFWDAIPESDKPFRIDPSITIPKCIPFGEGMVTPEVSRFVVEQKKFWGFESGRIYNTSRVIDGPYVELLEKLLSGGNDIETKHFVLGPFHPVEMTPVSKLRVFMKAAVWDSGFRLICTEESLELACQVPCYRDSRKANHANIYYYYIQMDPNEDLHAFISFTFTISH